MITSNNCPILKGWSKCRNLVLHDYHWRRSRLQRNLTASVVAVCKLKWIYSRHQQQTTKIWHDSRIAFIKHQHIDIFGTPKPTFESSYLRIPQSHSAHVIQTPWTSPTGYMSFSEPVPGSGGRHWLWSLPVAQCRDANWWQWDILSINKISCIIDTKYAWQ